MASVFSRPEVQSQGVNKGPDGIDGPQGRSFLTSPNFWWPQASPGYDCITIISTAILSRLSVLALRVPPKDIVIRLKGHQSSPGWLHHQIPTAEEKSFYPNKAILLGISC